MKSQRNILIRMKSQRRRIIRRRRLNPRRERKNSRRKNNDYDLHYTYCDILIKNKKNSLILCFTNV